MIANAQIDIPGPISGENPIESLGLMISFVFQVLLIIAGLYVFLQIILAGYGMISSGGDKHALEQARGKIIWAVIGLFIILISWGLVMFIEQIFGICIGFSCPINLGVQEPANHQLFIPTGDN
jgi:hypothetical protein